ncbi:MAG: type III pantothenate kinase [Deltaproteobacteria bacterium]|nr:type III pantothenate kinase [Candidatus Anaeroferrophillacea bacterium]
MILVVDVGNTHTVLGLFEGREMVDNWRIATHISRTEDEYGILLKDLLLFSGISLGQVSGMVVSCVVPPMVVALEGLARKYLGVKPMVIGPGVKTGMPIQLENPREVGADRIVNAVEAYETWRQALIVIDFGTATTFDCVSARGEYLGGVIAPGLQISTEALFQRASKLPRVELVQPPAVIGRNTVQSMQSGIVNGYISLVEGLVARLATELGDDPRVIATGGLAPLIGPLTEAIHEVDELLTLKGLVRLYEMNRWGERGERRR